MFGQESEPFALGGLAGLTEEGPRWAGERMPEMVAAATPSFTTVPWSVALDRLARSPPCYGEHGHYCVAVAGREVKGAVPSQREGLNFAAGCIRSRLPPQPLPSHHPWRCQPWQCDGQCLHHASEDHQLRRCSGTAVCAWQFTDDLPKQQGVPTTGSAGI